MKAPQNHEVDWCLALLAYVYLVTEGLGTRLYCLLCSSCSIVHMSQMWCILHYVLLFFVSIKKRFIFKIKTLNMFGRKELYDKNKKKKSNTGHVGSWELITLHHNFIRAPLHQRLRCTALLQKLKEHVWQIVSTQHGFFAQHNLLSQCSYSISYHVILVLFLGSFQG